MSGALPVCPRCGVLVATAKTVCHSCHGPAHPSLAVPARADACWVSVACTFACRLCGMRAPLDHLDVDGVVFCNHCGQEQAFPVASWQEGLEHAHAVGDLAGPQAELPSGNPFASLGTTDSFAVLQEKGMRIDASGVTQFTLQVRASPGRPLCGACRTPLEWSSDKRHFTTTCASCGARAEYLTPGTVHTLAGVIADGNRVGAVDARHEATAGGAVALRCPSCDAGLVVADETQMATCAYCKTVSRIAPRLWRQLQPKNAEPRPFWLLFRGRSKRRGELERKRKEAADEQAAAAARRAEKARADQARAATEAEEQRRQEARAAFAVGEEAKQRRSQILVGVVAVAAVAALFAGRLLLGATGTATSLTSPTNALQRAESALAQANRAPFPIAALTRNCVCRETPAPAKLQAGTLPIEGADGRFRLGLYFEEAAQPRVALALSAETAPPSLIEAGARTLGFACASDAAGGSDMILVDERRASAFHMASGALHWTRDLPAAYTPRSPSLTSPPGATPAAPIDCHELRVRDGAIELPAGGHTRVRIDAQTGAPRP